jgi:hypothetical protein
LISDHVHQHRLPRLDRTDHLWAPTTWAVLAERRSHPWARKRVESSRSA